MQLSHLEYLVAVKKHGSMNKAAAALFCAQPTISSAFHSLEKELGCRILDRSASGSMFTPEGERIVADAEVILGMIDRWRRLGASDDVELQIAFSTSFGTPPMLDLLFSYQRLVPEVKFKLVPSLRRGTDILTDDNGQSCRFGFFPRTPRELPETLADVKRQGLRIAMINRGWFRLCFSANHPLSQKEQIFLSDIRGLGAVLKGGRDGFPYYQYLSDAQCDCSMAMGDHANIMVALLNNPALISFRPDFILANDSYANSGMIVTRRLEGCPMEIDQYFVYPERGRITEPESRFLAYIRANARMFDPL